MQDTKTDNQYPSLNFEDLVRLHSFQMLSLHLNETAWLRTNKNDTRQRSRLPRTAITDILVQRVR